MLYEVEASDLDIANIVSPIRKLLRHVTFFHGDIESIDLVHKRAACRMGTRDIAIRCRTTTWCSPSGRSRTSSTSPAW